MVGADSHRGSVYGIGCEGVITYVVGADSHRGSVYCIGCEGVITHVVGADSHRGSVYCIGREGVITYVVGQTVTGVEFHDGNHGKCRDFFSLCRDAL